MEGLKKSAELALVSRELINRIRSLSAEVLQSYLPMIATFSSFFNILFRLIYQQMLFCETINKLSLSRIIINLPYDLGTDKQAQLEEELPPEPEEFDIAYPSELKSERRGGRPITQYLALRAAKLKVFSLSNLQQAKALSPNLATTKAEQPSKSLAPRLAKISAEETSIYASPSKIARVYKPETPQAFAPTELITPSLREPGIREEARLDGVPPVAVLSSTWFLPGLLLAHKITSDLTAALTGLNFNKMLSQILPVGREIVTQERKPLPQLWPQPKAPRKAASLPKRKLSQRPAKGILTKSPDLTQATFAFAGSEALAEAEIEEKPLKKTTEMPTNGLVTDWQTELAPIVFQSRESIASLLEYEKTIMLNVLSMATLLSTFPAFAGFSTQELPKLKPVAGRKEVGAVETLIERPPIALISKETTKQPHKHVSYAEETPIVVTPKTPSLRLAIKTPVPFGYAAMLPVVILEKQIPFLRIAAALSQDSPLPTAPLGSRPKLPSRFSGVADRTMLTDEASQIKPLTKESSSSLTPIMYNDPVIARRTGVILSTIPIAASKAGRIVAETLFQPFSTLTKTLPYNYEKPELGEARHVRFPTGIAAAGVGGLATSRLQQEFLPLERERAKTMMPLQPSAEVTEDITARGLENRVTYRTAKRNEIGLHAINEQAENTYISKSTSLGDSFMTFVATGSKLTTAMANATTYRNAIAQTSKIALIAESSLATVSPAARFMSKQIMRTPTGTSKNALEIKTEPTKEYLAIEELGIIQTLNQMTPAGDAVKVLLELGFKSAIAIVRASKAAMPSSFVTQLVTDSETVAVVPEGELEASRTLVVATLGTAFARETIPPRQPRRDISGTFPASRLQSKKSSMAPIIQEHPSVESDEVLLDEDLRELEKKINKILSEQLSRYYGTSKI